MWRVFLCFLRERIWWYPGESLPLSQSDHNFSIFMYKKILRERAERIFRWALLVFLRDDKLCIWRVILLIYVKRAYQLRNRYKNYQFATGDKPFVSFFRKKLLSRGRARWQTDLSVIKSLWGFIIHRRFFHCWVPSRRTPKLKLLVLWYWLWNGLASFLIGFDIVLFLGLRFEVKGEALHSNK